MTEPYYSDDAVTIYHGEALNVLADLPAGSVDALVTDPPYSSGGMFRSDRALEPSDKYRGWSQGAAGGSRKPTAEYGSFAGDNKDQRAFAGWVAAWSWQALRCASDGAHAFMFSDWRQLPTATDAMQFGGWTWRGVLVWDKGIGRPMRGRFRNHLEFIAWGTNGQTADSDVYPSALINVATVSTADREHVTQKPTELLRHLLMVLPERDRVPVILDPFMGSGTTLRAAADCGMRAIGIEVDERYCEIAAKRMAQGVLDFGGAS